MGTKQKFIFWCSCLLFLTTTHQIIGMHKIIQKYCTQTDSPLIAFAKKGKTDEFKLMFEQNPYINLDEQDKKRLTALHWSLINGHENFAIELMQHNARVDLPDINSQTPLHWATKKKVVTNKTRSSLTMIKKIIEYAPHTINLKDCNGYTPLIQTIIAKDSAAIALLRKHDVKLNIRTNKGNTVIMSTVLHGTSELLRSLILDGARVDTQSLKGETPLICAVKLQKTAHIKILVENGANLEIQDKLKNDVFYYCKNTETFQYLKTIKGYIDASNKIEHIKRNSKNSYALKYYFDYALHQGHDTAIRYLTTYLESNKEFGKYVKTTYKLLIPCKETTKLGFMVSVKQYLQKNKQWSALKKIITNEETPAANFKIALQANSAELVKIILPLLKFPTFDIQCFLNRLNNPKTLFEKHITVKEATEYKLSLGENEKHKNPLLRSKLHTNKDTDYICIKIIQDFKEAKITEKCLGLWHLYRMAQKNKAQKVEKAIVKFALDTVKN